MARTPCRDKTGLKKGTWTPEEDMKLIAYVTRYGHWNWRQLPNFAGLARCGKSCRLRWMNYLRPNIKKGNYTPQEEDTIIKLHAKLGNRWSMIASHLPGRSDNDIKNHWHANLKKRLQQNSVAHASARVSQPKDHSPLESRQESDSESDANICPFQSTPTETAAAGNRINMLLEDDHFAFIDKYTHEPVSADFWTQPYVADFSCFPSELLAPFVTEPEILSPVYDSKLWNHSE